MKRGSTGILRHHTMVPGIWMMILQKVLFIAPLYKIKINIAIYFYCVYNINAPIFHAFGHVT